MSQNDKSGLGCFAKLCIILAIVFVLVIGGVVGGSYYIVRKYTSDQASDIQVATVSDAQYQKVIEKMAFFTMAISNNSPARLQLTADDMNAAIAINPALSDVKGHCYFEIKNNQLITKASIPLNAIPGCSGRFLNGTFGLKVAMANGLLSANATSVEVNGSPITGQFMQSFQKQNLAEKINQNPNFSSTLRRVQDIAVSDNKLTIETKGWDPNVENARSEPLSGQTASNETGQSHHPEAVNSSRPEPGAVSLSVQPVSSPDDSTPSTNPLKHQQLPPAPIVQTNDQSSSKSIVIEGYDPPSE